MIIRFRPHAHERLIERGTTEEEVKKTVREGEQFEAKFDRVGFRRNIIFNHKWRGQYYTTKQIEAYAVKRSYGWLVISVITRYF